MSAERVFAVNKSSDMTLDYTIVFVPKDPSVTPWTVDSADCTATIDGTATDATSTVIHEASTQFSGNTLTFRLKDGTSGVSYLIKAVATMTTGEVLSAWGTLNVIDPT